MTSLWTSTKKVRTPKNLNCFYDSIVSTIIVTLLYCLYLLFDFIGSR